MSKTIVINKIKTLLGMDVNLETMKLDNGTVLEAESFEPNAEVFIVNEEERVALPIGEYILEGGMVLVVTEEGIIAEIKEPEAEAPAEEQAPEEAAETPELEAEVATPKKIEKSISETMFFAEIEKLRSEIAELKLSEVEPKEEVVVELTEEVKPIIASPESNVDKKQVNLYSQNKGKSVQDSVWNKIANFKNK